LLAASENPEDRKVWLRIAADYFAATRPADPEAIDCFAEALIARLEKSDAMSRLDTARRLANCPGTPRALLTWFEREESEACDFVLQHAVGLTEDALRHAAAQSARRAVAVAKRRDLSRSLVDALSLHQCLDVQLSLARNPCAALEGDALIRMLREAGRRLSRSHDRELADALLRRGSLQLEHAVLFLDADPGQRLEILLSAQRMELGRRSEIAAKADVVDRLEASALVRDMGKFVSELGQALGCSPQLAERIANDASGEPLALALAALGAPKDVLIRVLVATDLGSGDYPRIRTLARLSSALNASAAASIIAGIVDDSALRKRNSPGRDPELRRVPSGSEGRKAAARSAREPISPTSFVA